MPQTPRARWDLLKEDDDEGEHTEVSTSGRGSIEIPFPAPLSRKDYEVFLREFELTSGLEAYHRHKELELNRYALHLRSQRPLAVSSPAPPRELGPDSDDPFGLEGAELLEWMIAHPRITILFHILSKTPVTNEVFFRCYFNPDGRIYYVDLKGAVKHKCSRSSFLAEQGVKRCLGSELRNTLSYT